MAVCRSTASTRAGSLSLYHWYEGQPLLGPNEMLTECPMKIPQAVSSGVRYTGTSENKLAVVELVELAAKELNSGGPDDSSEIVLRVVCPFSHSSQPLRCGAHTGSANKILCQHFAV
jgi:hypothetical protein